MNAGLFKFVVVDKTNIFKMDYYRILFYLYSILIILLYFVPKLIRSIKVIVLIFGHFYHIPSNVGEHGQWKPRKSNKTSQM